MPSELLVTGCYRSGTTLLEKLLHAHPSACVASQPFPVLYAFVKKAFDEKLGIERRYPLNHRFLEDAYTDLDLSTFLDHHRLSAADLHAVFEGLEAYTEGLWTPEILTVRGSIRPGTFLDVYRQLCAAIANLFPKPDLQVVGTKEILVEEYVPYLLEQGVHVLVIVRDPRDVIASLDFNVRENRTGSDRPVLYSMRIWRKSVATALAFERHPRFRWLRYEDLVADPAARMAEVAQFLNLSAFPAGILESRLRDQRGRDWPGNSSFQDQARVSTASVGRFRHTLPAAVQSMIESVAAPEMTALGYAGSPFRADAITQYQDPFETIHGNFPADYSADPARHRSEVDRWSHLSGETPLSDEQARLWFLYPETYRKLRHAVGT